MNHGVPIYQSVNYDGVGAGERQVCDYVGDVLSILGNRRGLQVWQDVPLPAPQGAAQRRLMLHVRLHGTLFLDVQPAEEPVQGRERRLTQPFYIFQGIELIPGRDAEGAWLGRSAFDAPEIDPLVRLSAVEPADEETWTSGAMLRTQIVAADGYDLVGVVSP